MIQYDTIQVVVVFLRKEDRGVWARFYVWRAYILQPFKAKYVRKTLQVLRALAIFRVCTAACSRYCACASCVSGFCADAGTASIVQVSRPLVCTASTRSTEILSICSVILGA